MTYTNWNDVPLVLDVDEAAKVLKVHPNTIINMIRDGRLPAVKVGRAWRITKNAILAHLDGNQEAGNE